MLLDGQFNSVFRGRLTNRFKGNESINFRERSDSTKMIVVSDGDIIKNHVREDGQILPLGFDRFTRKEYGNKDFIVNAINYLCGEDQLMVVRSRSLKIRLLDQTRIKEEKLSIQVFNMAVPMVLVLVFGLMFNFYRKKKYSKAA